jgi:predicted esterase
MEKSFRASVPRYYELELPSNHAGRKRWPLLIALHGYEGNKDSMMRMAKRVAAESMVVISLQGLHQFFPRFGMKPRDFRVGFGWGTTYKMEDSVQLHQRDLEAVMALAVRNYRADPRRIFLMAFSQACAFNYRYIFTHPRAIRGAIAVCGGVPFDWNENPQYRPAATRILHIAAKQDEWYSREKYLVIRRQLRQRAARLDFRFYNTPHRFPPASVPHIRKWIGKNL